MLSCIVIYGPLFLVFFISLSHVESKIILESLVNFRDIEDTKSNLEILLNWDFPMTPRVTSLRLGFPS